ncbi:rRNA-processing protein las1 [Malassezia yamatoensis]|uniref:rRNA-processing protein las1 n=1 Tax=Malassezia yamatoensis TaxID=253288 RepID=A0AAJ5YR96_9BASI|nr:rRNA-processing protein las1 [Malassezia yamatoensis]
MRLPRRTPFYAPANEELAYVHGLLYIENADTESISSGVKIVRLWLNRTSCPQAVEATALLFQAQLLDRAIGAQEGTRAAYSMSIVRFVNSVVDSFQTGMYAQSIGAIAERIGLPQWLVQVRHSATHEELPSIAVCREACSIALHWLNHHYWLPTLSPSLAQDSTEYDDEEPRRQAAAEAAHLLHTYRAHAQALARDRSLALRGTSPLVKVVEDLENWVHNEADRLATQVSDRERGEILSNGWPRDNMEDNNEAAKLAQATTLMILSTQLLLPGAFIPATKERKLGLRDDVRVENLPEDHLSLWDPLIVALQSAFPILLPILIQAWTNIASGGSSSKEQSYAATARAWLAHFSLDAPYKSMQVTLDAPRWKHPMEAGQLPLSPVDVEAVPVWKETLLTAPLYRLVIQYAMETDAPSAWDFAKKLANQEIAQRISQLIALRKNIRVQENCSLVNLIEMEKRSEQLRGLKPISKTDDSHGECEQIVLAGWSRSTSWSPTPIGCIEGGCPSLLI